MITVDHVGRLVRCTPEVEATLAPADRGDTGILLRVTPDGAAVGWDSGTTTLVPCGDLEVVRVDV